MLAVAPDPGSNSIATLVKHLAGNMRSRWKDFLTTRRRKARSQPRRGVRAALSNPRRNDGGVGGGWKQLFDTLATLTDADLPRRITIRGEAHSVLQAITRQNTHCAYHVGQIVYLAKHFAGDQWKTLTVPRGKSAEYNATIASGKASQR